MPKGPQWQKRPADVIGNAVHIAKIATGEIEDTKLKQPAKRNSGMAGSKARAEKLTAAERSEIELDRDPSPKSEAADFSSPDERVERLYWWLLQQIK